MTAQPIPVQPRRGHPHPHGRPVITLNATTDNAATLSATAADTSIPLTVMPAHAGIQRLGSCGVRS